MNGQEPGNDMASQQPPDELLAFPELKPGDAWGESITQKRASELEAILQAWEAEKEHGERRGPFDKKPGEFTVKSLTGADVFWLAEQSGPSKYGHVPNLHLEGADLLGAHLEGADLHEAHLEGAHLLIAHLEGADLHEAHLEGANFLEAHLEGVRLSGAHLEGTRFLRAHLEGADLREAHLERARLSTAHLEGADLKEAHLEGADLRMAYFDSSTTLVDVILGSDDMGYVSLADVRWADVNLAVVDWTHTTRSFLGIRRRIDAIELGDEREAHNANGYSGTHKDKATRLQDYKDAVRANRQLATALRNQGLNEDADRFAYKAQQLQREVLRRQRRFGAAFGSWLLDVIAGHGYKPMRTLTVYLAAIISFAVAYFALGQIVGPHLSPLGAFVFSMTSFHGRGFFPGGIVLDDPITVLAAFEAFFGLVIEVSFIATFTQRFFAR